jgi:hypothetical protein
MISQQYFTDSEWITLLQAPSNVIMAIVLADKTDPVSFLREVRTAMQILQSEQNQTRSNDLVQALLTTLKEFDARQSLQGEELLLKKEFQLLGAIQELKNASEGQTKAIDHLKQVSSILSAKVTLNQAEEFKQWLLNIGHRVAESVKEGGIMGIGGEPTSNAEAAVLRKLEQALNGTR